MNRINPIDVGWIAGIIEGEGWFVKNPKSLRVSVAMTDYDTIERIHRLTGIGQLNERKFKKKKDQLRWDVGVYGDIEALLNLILPLMSARRSGQIREVLVALEKKRIERERRAIEFVCGHPKSEENTYHFKNSDKTSCRQCGRDRDRVRYARQKA